MSPDDVDFTVTSYGDGADEDLPQPERRPWSPARRVAAGVVAVAALVAVGIGVVSARPSAPSAAKSSAAKSPVPPVASPTFVPRSGITRFVPPPDVIVVDRNTGAVACPQAGDGQSACESTHAVPAGVLAALRAHFPGARVTAETDQTLRDTGLGPGGLWYRRVTATAGSIRIAVMVRRPLPEDVTTGDYRIVKDRTVQTESTGSGGFTVTVTVDAPSSHPSLSGAVDLLVSDTRLLVLR